MEIRTLRPADLEEAWELDRDSFHEPPENRELFVEWQDPSRFVGAFDGGRLVALSGVHEFGQFFGGRSVSMGGLTSVSVAAHRRGLTGRKAQVRLDGGPLALEWREDGHMVMSGPVATSFTGVFARSLLPRPS